jgi:hypothetical protein
MTEIFVSYLGLVEFISKERKMEEFVSFFCFQFLSFWFQVSRQSDSQNLDLVVEPFWHSIIHWIDEPKSKSRTDPREWNNSTITLTESQKIVFWTILSFISNLIYRFIRKSWILPHSQHFIVATSSSSQYLNNLSMSSVFRTFPKIVLRVELQPRRDCWH